MYIGSPRGFVFAAHILGSQEVKMGVYKRPDSKKWWISFYQNGKRVREPVSTKKNEAEKVLTQRLNAINEGKHPVIKKRKDRKIKFVAFSETYLTDYSKPNKKSWKSDIHRLKPLIEYFGDFNLTDIENQHVAEYKKLRLQQTVKGRDKLISPATVNKEVKLLKNILKKAAKWKGIEIHDLELDLAAELPRERILPHKEIRQLIDNASPPLKYAIMVALNTGMRKGEILTLEWSNVNLERNFITVKAQENKSKRLKRIPINSELRKLFLKLKLSRDGNKYVFQNPLTGSRFIDFGRSWRSLLTRTGIDDMRFHDLRHTFASHFLMNGGDLYTLKEILGHKELNTTARYLTVTTDHKARAMEIFQVAETEPNIIDISGAGKEERTA
jgi:integrase